jgi:hypothetical protein
MLTVRVITAGTATNKCRIPMWKQIKKQRPSGGYLQVQLIVVCLNCLRIESTVGLYFNVLKQRFELINLSMVRITLEPGYFR